MKTKRKGGYGMGTLDIAIICFTLIIISFMVLKGYQMSLKIVEQDCISDTQLKAELKRMQEQCNSLYQRYNGPESNT